jgi:PEP-CTERM motif
MATTRARTVALAAVLAAGMLCEGLVCQPAQADVVAFNGTLAAGSEFYVSLELFNGSTLLTTVSSEGAQGSIYNGNPPVPPSLGGAAGGSTSYTAGLSQGDLVANYFLFNLGGVTTQTVTSAELVIYSGIVDQNMTFNLSSISQSTITGLENQGPDSNTTLYADLTTGTTSYGSFPVLESSSSPGTLLTFTITNQAALAAINAAIADGTFGLGGTVSGYTVPEPSTWVMMLAGFAGLGYVGRRRAAKRRAAAG